MKSVEELICFQEIPNEISLGLFISNCPNKCKNCHSPWLREDIGREVLSILPSLLREWHGKVSCILFMGGDDDAQIDELERALHYCKIKGYKTALYSGFDICENLDRIEHWLDYYKVGSYMEDKGSLKYKTTNQQLFKKENEEWKDITYMFWTSPLDNENSFK